MKLTIPKDFTTESGDTIFLEFDCEYVASTDAYYSNHFGNWLPGDLPEVKILHIRCDKEELTGKLFDFFYYRLCDVVKSEVLKEVERAA